MACAGRPSPTWLPARTREAVPDCARPRLGAAGEHRDAGQIPLDPLTEQSRAAVQDLLEHVTLVEAGDEIYAEVDPGRVDIAYGAEERT